MVLGSIYDPLAFWVQITLSGIAWNCLEAHILSIRELQIQHLYTSMHMYSIQYVNTNV